MFTFGGLGISCKKSENPLAYVAGQTYYGSKNYVRYLAGELKSPIILSSGHDGILDPADVPDREQGTFVRDVYASDLTLKIADSIKNITGLRPHIIINDLKRSKLDPNRSLSEGYLSHEASIKAYQEYHQFIQIAKETIRRELGKGIYFDIHGHGHDKARIEIGYLLNISQLNGTDIGLDALSPNSSIYHIANQSSYSFSQLIRGPLSLGSLLHKAGLPAIPSTSDPQPLSDPYFNGGYSTLIHGSINGGSISAIQLETPGPLVRNTPTLRADAAGKMARVIKSYLKEHLNL